MENQHKITIYFLLFLIVLGGFYIRYKGIWFGYPLPVHPDEPFIVEKALKMLDTGDLNPHFFNYPSLNIYLQASVYSLLNFVNIALNNHSATDLEIQFYIIGRLFVVLLSLITIYVIFEIGRRLISPMLGLASACFLSASWLHILYSFTIAVDSTVALWASLVTLMAVLIYTKGKKLCYYLLGGIFVGLAISSKYTAFVSVAPLLIAHLKMSRENRDWIDKNIIFGSLLIPMAFFITTPYAILDYKTFLEALKHEAVHYRTGHAGFEASGSVSYHLYGKYLVTRGYGLLPILFSGFGLVWLLKKDPWKALILIGTPVLLFVFVGQYKVFFARNIVAVIPFLALLSGSSVFAIYECLKRMLSKWEKHKWITIGIYIIIIVLLVGSIYPQVNRARKNIRHMTLPDSRWISLQWVKDHLPDGSKVGREFYTPPIEKYTEKFRVSALGLFGVARKLEKAEKLEYIIVSSYDYKRFLKSPEKYPHKAVVYKNFFKSHHLVHEFVPDGKTLGGPTIKIFRILKKKHEK